MLIFQTLLRFTKVNKNILWLWEKNHPEYGGGGKPTFLLDMNPGQSYFCPITSIPKVLSTQVFVNISSWPLP